jgi:hypothetical protein
MPGVACTLIRYDTLRRQGVDIFGFFLAETLGIDDVAPARAAENERLSLEMTEFIRLLSLETGYGRGRDRPDALNIGAAVKLVLRPAFRRQVEEAMRAHAGAARRTIEMPREAPWFVAMQQDLVVQAGEHLRPALAAGEPLFAAEPARWEYYDAEALRAVPQVRALLDEAVARLGPNSPALRLANAGKRAVRRWRSLRKFFWLGRGGASEPAEDKPKRRRRAAKRGRG